MRVKIAVRTIFDFLHLVLANLHQRLRDRRQLRRRRVKNDAVVEDPLCRCQKCLGRSVTLLFDVLLHGAQVHGAGDVVLVGGELCGIDGFGEGFNARDGLHSTESVLKKNAELVDFK